MRRNEVIELTYHAPAPAGSQAEVDLAADAEGQGEQNLYEVRLPGREYMAILVTAEY